MEKVEYRKKVSTKKYPAYKVELIFNEMSDSWHIKRIDSIFGKTIDKKEAEEFFSKMKKVFMG